MIRTQLRYKNASSGNEVDKGFQTEWLTKQKRKCKQ